MYVRVYGKYSEDQSDLPLYNLHTTTKIKKSVIKYDFILLFWFSSQ